MRKIRSYFYQLIGLVGVLFAFGAPGSPEIGRVEFGTVILYMLIGVGLMVISYFGLSEEDNKYEY